MTPTLTEGTRSVNLGLVDGWTNIKRGSGTGTTRGPPEKHVLERKSKERETVEGVRVLIREGLLIRLRQWKRTRVVVFSE